METTPMTFNVKMTWDEYAKHPLTLECYLTPAPYTFHQYLKLEHNITIIDSECDFDSGNEMVMVKFQSAQDYTLWKLHQ